ncbi:MAG: O-antigen ligase family protein, partial [Armatimonadota bacterium]
SWYNLRTVLWAVFGVTCAAAVFGLLQYACCFTIPGIHTWYVLDAMRATGTTIGPHFFAFILVTAAGYGIALATSSASWRARLAAAAGTALIAGALLTTMTRSSLVFGLGVLLVAASYNMSLGGRRRTAFLVACSLLALSAAACVLAPPIRTRFAHLTAESSLSVASRLRTNRTGIAIALHHPLGVGVGNAEHQYDLFRAGDDLGTKRSSHNMYLELAGTVGWPGLACFLLFLWTLHAGAARAEARLRRAGERRQSLLLAGLRAVLYAFAVQGLFWHQILTSKLIWVTMGMIGAGTAIALDSKGPGAGDCAGRGDGGAQASV